MKSAHRPHIWLQAVAAVSLVATTLSFTSPTSVVLADTNDVALTSTYVATPPVIDGSIGFGEWNLANKVPFAHGFISTMNDGIRLYVLIDALGDTTDETISADNFWLSFDVNRNGVIDPNQDLNYGLNSDSGNMRYQYYLGPGTWTGLQPNTFSARGRGFGCFFADGSLSLGSPLLFRFRCSQHRVWELAIDLAEIGAVPGGHAKMGARIHSGLYR